MENKSPMFEKGDIVECVDASGSNPPLIKGAKYILNDIDYCPKCRKPSFDVGLRITGNPIGSMCGGCGYTNNDTSTTAFYAPARFRKIATNYRTVEIASEIKELITEVLETPDLK